MKTTKIIQKDYSLSSMNSQSKLPFELEVLIPADDPVRHTSFRFNYSSRTSASFLLFYP